MTGSAPEYQYNLKDHLGNVRVTFTSKEETETATATLEDANTAAEQGQFLNYEEAVTLNERLFDHTHRVAGNQNNTTFRSTRLLGASVPTAMYGLAKSLSVMPGDKITAKVYAKYVDSNDALAFEEGEIKITEPGFVYIYFSNENESQVEVFFDDFEVTHVKSPVVQVDDYYPFGLTFNSYQRENSTPNDYKFSGKEEQTELNLLTYDYGARMYDPALGKWWQVDPLSEKYQSWSPYAYVVNNPLKFMDPTGMFSTHTNEDGEVVAVYDDGDNGVYKHEKNADDGSVTKAQVDKRHKKSTSGGGEKMGETEYWDEFINPGSGDAEGTIYFGESQSWDPLIEWGNEKATNQDLMITKKESENHGILDIKENKGWAPGGNMDGRLLNGKYATARSAGNYLAGMNGVTGTFQGEHVSGETYMKLAGAYQQKQLSKVNAALIVTTGISFGPAPYYGEETYSGRRIQDGINAGNKKLKK